MKAQQECLRNHTNCVDLWKLGKSAWDQELWKIQCAFCCLMRWCQSTPGSPKYILPVAIVKGRTVCIGYGVITRYRSKGPRCVGNGRVVWSLKEQSWTLGTINTAHRSVYLRKTSISGPSTPASPCQTEWSWWWETDFSATLPAWTGPDWACPVQDWQSAVQSSLAILLDQTGLSVVSDCDHPDGGSFRSKEASSEGRGIIKERSGSG